MLTVTVCGVEAVRSIEAGENVQAVSAGKPEHARLTVPVKEFCEARLSVRVPG
jgi:hypothetical protein